MNDTIKNYNKNGGLPYALFAFLFFGILPLLRYLSISLASNVTTLEEWPLRCPILTLSYCSIYGIVYACWILIFFKNTLHKGLEKKVQRVPTPFLTILLVFTSLALFSSMPTSSTTRSGLQNIAGVVLGLLIMFQITETPKLIIKTLLIPCAILMTGRGLAASFFLYILFKKNKKSTAWKLTVCIFIFSFMLALDFIRKGGLGGWPGVNALWQITYSFPFFDAIDALISHYDDHSFRYMGDILTYSYFFVPRLLFASKPYNYGDELNLTREVYNASVQEKTYAFTSAGVAYSNFGVFGILIFPFLEVGLLIIIKNFLSRTFWTQSNFTIEFACFLLLVRLLRGGLEGAIYQLPFIIFALGINHYVRIFRLRNKKQQRYSVCNAQT